jgi:hypothetical protein
MEQHVPYKVFRLCRTRGKVNHLPLRIRPVQLRGSVYFRVPNDIADLIEIHKDTDVTMRIEEQNDRFLLVYCIRKSQVPTD